jgi:hypothetical protein
MLCCAWADIGLYNPEATIVKRLAKNAPDTVDITAQCLPTIARYIVYGGGVETSDVRIEWEAGAFP